MVTYNHVDGAERHQAVPLARSAISNSSKLPLTPAIVLTMCITLGGLTLFRVALRTNDAKQGTQATQLEVLSRALRQNNLSGSKLWEGLPDLELEGGWELEPWVSTCSDSESKSLRQNAGATQSGSVASATAIINGSTASGNVANNTGTGKNLKVNYEYTGTTT
jgi:hypothetical protein